MDNLFIIINMVNDPKSRELLAALEGRNNRGTTYHARLLLSLCYLHWFAGDFSSLSSVARSNVQIGEEFGLPESLLLGNFFLGVAHYPNLIIGGTVSVATLGFALFIMLFETLVALIQAYIFTVLSAIFVSLAVAEEH